MLAIGFELLSIVGDLRCSQTLMMLTLNMLMKTMPVVMFFSVAEAFG